MICALIPSQQLYSIGNCSSNQKVHYNTIICNCQNSPQHDELPYNVLSFYFFLQTFHAVYNITANERVNFKRYRYLMDGKGAFYNPFNRGIVHNLKEFFLLVKPRTEQDVEILNIWNLSFHIYIFLYAGTFSYICYLSLYMICPWTLILCLKDFLLSTGSCDRDEI